MCTLVAAVNQFAEWPLIVAANRDEALQRPSSPPLVWPGQVSFIAPRDEVAGGTWLGLNRNGLFVAITNRFGAPQDAQRKSRGALVASALEQPSAEALHRTLTRLSPNRFNAFHLLYADPKDAFVTWSDGTRVLQEKLPPGLHVVTERSLGGEDRGRSERLKTGWRGLLHPVAPTVEQLASLMRQHRPEDPVGSACVHAPELLYGTKSSALLFLNTEFRKSRLLWAEGSPCVNPYVEQNHLLSALMEEGL